MKKDDRKVKLFNNALSSLSRGNLQRFKISVTNLDDINYPDKDERTLVFYSVFQNDMAALQILLDNGANINLFHKIGWTPLHYAVNEHFVDIAKLLIKTGADVKTIDAHGNSIIWRATFASKGRGEIIKALLEHGSKPSIKNNSGISALELAKTIANYDVKQFFKN